MTSLTGRVEGAASPRCWCGQAVLEPYAPGYLRCRGCGTLASSSAAWARPVRVADERTDFYGLNYFTAQARAIGHPDLFARSRLDLSERCVHWLKSLLRRRPPPARTLEIGCGNGSFVGLLTAAGYDATGLDLSPAVTAHAHETFEVPVLTGPLDEQQLPPASFDCVVMMDVLEHLADPLALLARVRNLLREDGFVLAQTPRFEPERSYEDLRATNAPFLEMMRPEEHLFLLSEGSARELMARAGLAAVAFEPAIFSMYDMSFVASPRPIGTVAEDEWRASLRRSRTARVVEALVDAWDAQREAAARAAKLGEVEADRAARLEVILTLQRQLADARARAAGLEHASATFSRRVRGLFRTQRRAGPHPEADRARGAEIEGASRGKPTGAGTRPHDAPTVAPADSPRDLLDALRVLRRAGRVDYEQLLAFQYSKLVRPGDGVIDVGAHSGLHAARLLRLVGDAGAVTLVEPIPYMVERFLRPSFGARPNCRIFQGAVAGEVGRTRFRIRAGREQESALATDADDSCETIEVDVSTIDVLAAGQRVAFVKVDVEGAELKVLSGAAATLSSSRPVVAVESGSGSIAAFGGSPGALFDLARSHGYEVATLTGAPLSRAGFEACASSGVVWDFFLLPEEHRASLRHLLLSEDSPFLADRVVDLRETAPSVHADGYVGFSFVESWGRWTDARLCDAARIQLAAPLPAAFTLEIVAMGSRGPRSPFDVVVGGQVRTLEAPAGTIATLVTSFRTDGTERVVEVRPHQTICPADTAAGGDPRRLGIGIQSVRVVRG